MKTIPIAEKNRVEGLVSGVEGWLTAAEGALLYRLAREARAPIAEIGAWKGRSTIWLGSGSKAGSVETVYSVDPHVGSAEHHELYGAVNTLDEFRFNVARAGLDDIVVPVIATSVEAASRVDGPFALVFIDGAHDYQSVLDDLEAWAPKLLSGGSIAFHDAAAPGPRRVIADQLVASGNYAGVGFVDSIVYAQKRRPRSPLERLHDRSMLPLKSIVDSSRATRPPQSVRRVGKAVLRVLMP